MVAEGSGIAIRLEGVGRRFGAVQAVDGLSFKVERGEIFGLLGPNGAGKTTTINLITGLLRRDRGRIEVLGFDPGRQARQVRARIGLAPQETNVYEDLNALDNLWHHAALYNDDLKAAKNRIEELLRLMALWERRKDPLRAYSGGMKRRLALARALLHNPALILFDEPTLGVDVQGRHALWDHIRGQRQQGVTFVVSTNDMTEADRLCDRLAIIDRGRAIALDTPENLKSALGRDIITLRSTPPIEDPQALFDGLAIQAITRPQFDQLRFETPDGEAVIGEIAQRVGQAHRLEAMRVARPTLDDVFLQHTGRGLRE
jgi:ABC-type multidrug transport system ATPase subunit